MTELKLFSGTDPAANTEITETVPAGEFWAVHAVKATFVTDATVANRYVELAFDDGTTEFLRIASADAIAAGATRGLNWAGGMGAAVNGMATTGQATIPMPIVLLKPGYRIKTVTTNRQSGDNFGAPQILYRRYSDQSFSDHLVHSGL